MLGKEKMKNIPLDFMVDDDFMRAFRHNVGLYLSNKELTLGELSEMSGISAATLNSQLYGNSNDIKMSTAIKIAKALNVSVDELMGGSTLSNDLREGLKKVRCLSDHNIRLIIWMIDHLSTIEHRLGMEKKTIMIRQPDVSDGNIRSSNKFKMMDVRGIPESVMSKAFTGFQLLCENYMPIYLPEDVLIIANDRRPKPNETAVIFYGGCIYLASLKGSKYHSIRDGKWRCDEKDIDELLGYVSYVIPAAKAESDFVHEQIC